jgi:hypothetical protein
LLLKKGILLLQNWKFASSRVELAPPKLEFSSSKTGILLLQKWKFASSKMEICFFKNGNLLL